jgi:hypothetical protein
LIDCGLTEGGATIIRTIFDRGVRLTRRHQPWRPENWVLKWKPNGAEPESSGRIGIPAWQNFDCLRKLLLDKLGLERCRISLPGNGSSPSLVALISDFLKDCDEVLVTPQPPLELGKDASHLAHTSPDIDDALDRKRDRENEIDNGEGLLELLRPHVRDLLAFAD